MTDTVTPQLALPVGYNSRPATLEDIPAVVALKNTCSLAHFNREDTTAQQLKSDWTEPDFDLASSSQVVLAPDGQLIGYAEVWDTHAIPVHPWVWVNIHPDYESQNIPRILYQWGDETARRVIPKCPPDARISYFTGLKTGLTPLEGVLEEIGMQAIRYSYFMRIEMHVAPDVPATAAGITIRPYRHPEDAEAAYRADTNIFKDHFGFVEEPFEIGFPAYQHFAENELQADQSYLAIDDASGEVAAISLSGIHSGMGWVHSLGVRRAWRKQGLGLAILRHNFRSFWDAGISEVELSVDASSLTGATRLYERAGMHISRKLTRYEKELRSGVEIMTTSADE